MAMRGGIEWALHERLADMAGEDSLQALCMAVSVLRSLLEDVTAKGGHVLDPSDRSECQLDTIFGRLGSNANEAAKARRS